MERFIELAEKNIAYTLRLSPRAKRMRFTVSAGGVFVVTAPKITPQSFIEKMLRTRAEWVIKQIERLSKFAAPTPRLSIKEKKAKYKEHKAAALALARRRTQYLNRNYGFSYQKISIRDQKTRWGSCSKKGNLSFSYKIALMPEYLADYIIVHELCHLGSFDHSATFWSLVAKTVPNHKALRKELRQRALEMR
jgi:predicted metal-dependent hydrolase